MRNDAPLAATRQIGGEDKVFFAQRQTKVRDIDSLVGVQQQVGGLDVAMDQALGVRVVQRFGNRDDPLRCSARTRTPVPPLTAARAVMAAKATSLAGAALAGLWLGLLVYVLPSWTLLPAAQSDGVTGIIGLVGALIMMGGALYLEYCCRAPDQD